MDAKINQVGNLQDFIKTLTGGNAQFGLLYSIDDHAGRIVDSFEKSSNKEKVVILKQPNGEDFAKRLMVKELPILISFNEESKMIEIEATGVDAIKERYSNDD